MNKEEANCKKNSFDELEIRRAQVRIMGGGENVVKQKKASSLPMNA